MVGKPEDIELVIVTGLSGAGKTQAVWSLEDLGFFCVDNLPPTFIPKFAELCLQSQGKINRVALVIDIRGGEFFSALFEALAQLDKQNFKYQILFLDASDQCLVRRFKESRRRHPLSEEGAVLDGITEERHRLEELKGRADKIIDTTDMTVGIFKKQIKEIFQEKNKKKQLSVNIVSFGFKYGVPIDADLLVDVRFLPNPFYIDELRLLTGTHEAVQQYVLDSPGAIEFLEKYKDLVLFLLPNYIIEGKTSIVIAVGCTGGQHRSVTLACKLGQIIEAEGYSVNLRHRDAARNVALLERKK
ncbi:UPF0042 nucleotide-binding protein [Desulfitispora alkaliphila]|uniref:RNase adapter RapZ n=1 Tax=Desulfitispora alkaliphila TaxID=622674 RepID=UPI003D1A802B